METNQLTKRYGKFTALEEVSIELKRGEIYGLIGKNGAGKTTIMRLIAGLSFPTSGTITLFGKKKPTQKEREKIGVMIEAPAIVGDLTAKETLFYFGKLKGIRKDEQMIDQLLLEVGLENTGKKKTKNFSLGMKQRLGIAIALLNEPKLLILDEPTNGLDPVGVVEIRSLLRNLLEDRQLTILLSSHNLPEMYQLATEYIIIHKGKIINQVSLNALDKQTQHYLRIASKQSEKLQQVITKTYLKGEYAIQKNQEVYLYQYEEPEQVMRNLFAENILPVTFVEQEDTLEEYFLSLVGSDSR
ncbi:ABC transporter ATP-binding protein [Enterococcus sp. AZ196]|uniref:ABC transporter ATP-binding protein n=1 Tax=Enterococcus sp. AZ196 TaxID=2774659 RepID=UPI003D26AEA3